MTITLLNQEEFDRLIQIQKEFPALTFQHEPYQYVDKNKFNETDRKAFDEVSEILDKHIKGFIAFSNFYHDNKKELNIRFKYDWQADNDNKGNLPYFEGLGYLFMEDLIKGFSKVIRRENILTGKTNQMRLIMTDEQLERWQNGEHVQDVFPHYSKEIREFLISGMLPEEQDEIFGRPDDDDDDDYYLDNDNGPTGHGDECYSDADNGL